MTDCHDRDSAAYALGALSAEEAAEFEAALGESAELRAEVDGFAETAALLALAAPPVAPSPALKASVLAAIGEQPHEARLVEGRHLASRPRPRRSREGRRALIALVVAAAAVVLFVAGALAGGLLGSLSEERMADRFAALNAAPDVIRTVTPLPDGGSISLVASERLGATAVVLHDAELPEDRTFQAWYVGESGPESAGVVEPAATGYTMLEGRWDGESVAMTIEPAGGSPEPTTEPMVLIDGDSA